MKFEPGAIVRAKDQPGTWLGRVLPHDESSGRTQKKGITYVRFGIDPRSIWHVCLDEDLELVTDYDEVAEAAQYALMNLKDKCPCYRPATRKAFYPSATGYYDYSLFCDQHDYVKHPYGRSDEVEEHFEEMGLSYPPPHDMVDLEGAQHIRVLIAKFGLPNFPKMRKRKRKPEAVQEAPKPTKVLLMGTHWDSLNLPEGVKHFPHRHCWRVNDERSSLDKYGRPYCTVCKGMPSHYSLDLVVKGSTEYTVSIKDGLRIEVEADYTLQDS